MKHFVIATVKNPKTEQKEKAIVGDFGSYMTAQAFADMWNTRFSADAEVIDEAFILAKIYG